VLVSFKELWRAYKSCQKNKASSINAIKFELNASDNLWKLHYEINSGIYKPKRYITFIAKSPKTREVFASDFSDRVVHHLLINDLEPLFEPTFIFDSYSCRKGKGIHTAVKRTQKFSRREKNKFYLQLDIKNFFLSIQKQFLFDLIRDRVSEKSSLLKSENIKERISYLSKVIIFDNPTENFVFRGDKRAYKDLPKHKSLFYTPKTQGLPIGNLTSQFFANVYLNPLDQVVKRVLKGDYLRYVDDFVLFGETKEELLEKKEWIESFLETNLELKLRDSFKLQRVENGIDFLGYIIRPSHILVRKRVVNNFKYKLAKFIDSKQTKEQREHFYNFRASYEGHFKHADSYRLRKKYHMLK
jgi:RNA-directed DNA polymerase